ncbi:MAG: S-adenosylmethionine:tRNA ribosyltransferase-isomerase, partial [Rhodobacteraceae bacterium]|nr:S-adenosylmethionine:tRNA ribosyltransferase-isomerase [Paracoccaceae bacterium]
PRSAARLLVAEGDGIADRVVRDLADILQPGDRLVLNDTRVIPARLSGTRTRETGQGPATARIEATLLEPRPDGTWAALMKPLRKVREGEEIRFSDRLSARVERIAGGQADLRFNLAGD